MSEEKEIPSLCAAPIDYVLLVCHRYVHDMIHYIAMVPGCGAKA